MSSSPSLEPREDVEFWSQGEVVRSWYLPSSSGKAPTVVLCPGFTGTKFAAFYEPYARFLLDSGRHVLMLDYRGWGESDGTRGDLVPSRQVADVRAALSYLETRNDVDADHLSLLGFSFGGGIVAQTSGLDSRVKCSMSISPVVDGTRWLRQMRREYEWYELIDRVAEDRRQRALGGSGIKVTPTEDILVSTPERRATRVKGNVPEGMVPTETSLSCVEDIMAFRVLDVADRISPTALLTFCVTEDSIVPPDHSRSLYAAAAEPKRIVELPGRLHYAAYLDHLDIISKEILQWLDTHE